MVEFNHGAQYQGRRDRAARERGRLANRRDQDASGQGRTSGAQGATRRRTERPAPYGSPAQVPRDGSVAQPSTGRPRKADHEGGEGGDPRLRPGGRLILDSSAILAVLLLELERESILDRMDDAASVAVGAPTLAETSLVAV